MNGYYLHELANAIIHETDKLSQEENYARFGCNYFDKKYYLIKYIDDK